MPSPAPKKTSTDQFQRQGHTEGPYGNTPSIEAMGQPAEPAKEIKP
jgi:hypothetical protein